MRAKKKSDDSVQELVGARFMTVRQLRDRWGGVSHMFIERKIKEDPRFPKPQKLGSTIRFFRIDEVEAYERQCARGEVA